MSENIEKVSQLWCLPKHSKKAMDADLAYDIAKAIDQACQERDAEIKRLKETNFKAEVNSDLISQAEFDLFACREILKDAIECDGYDDHTSGIWQIAAKKALSSPSSKRYDAVMRVVDIAKRIDIQLPKVEPNKRGEHGTVRLAAGAPIYETAAELKEALEALERM